MSMEYHYVKRQYITKNCLLYMFHALSSITGGYRFGLWATRNILVAFVLHRDPLFRTGSEGGLPHGLRCRISTISDSLALRTNVDSSLATTSCIETSTLYGYCSKCQTICQGILSGCFFYGFFFISPREINMEHRRLLVGSVPFENTLIKEKPEPIGKENLVSGDLSI